MIVADKDISEDRIADLCLRWKVVELSLFGSVARNDAHAGSDVDVLVSFEANAPWNLWDLGRMGHELTELFGRNVDLVEERSLVNPYRRRSILRDKRLVYAAG